MNSNKKRINFTPKEKAQILKRHFVEKIPVSVLCNENNLHPTTFKEWQKKLFDEGVSIFESAFKKQLNYQERKLKALEEKLKRKDEVLSELMKENIKLKKKVGEN